MPSSPSTSSADESLLSAEIQGVQSKPFGPQATATSTKSFDSGQCWWKLPSSSSPSTSSEDESLLSAEIRWGPVEAFQSTGNCYSDSIF
ncbi:hypothetical protein TSUD_323270 [Trifolium subterraneum]|uniref:Uncharacterized protein n=1 Tax=Trifolium subterraneum TaxID=3900 RepID=A0A2Z6N924_TRISU|nr:hypothetical protein TSUD_323270 [Trifolium subterraneum]